MEDTNIHDCELEALREENRILREVIKSLSAKKPECPEEDPQVFKLALAKVSDAIAMLTLDGDIIYANNQFLKEYGVDNKDGISKIYDLPIVSISKQDFENKIEEIRANGGQLQFYSDYNRPEDSGKSVHQVSAFITETAYGEVVWLFMQDITELIKRRDELREVNSLLNSIIDNLPLYLFVKDVDNDLRYVIWNKAFANQSKIPASKVIGRTDFDVFPVFEDAQKFRNDDMEVITTNEPINRHETYEAADGKIRICQTLKTLVHRDGRGPLLMGLSWDITNLQDIEQELVQERLRAENSDRLKSTFLANMSHEIRTPLNAIVGFSDLLAKTDDQEQRALFADIIKQNSDSLLQLINDILDISKIEAGTLEYIRAPFDLNELFDSIYETNKNRMHDDVQLVHDICGNPPKVIINEDRNRIMQIVTNLINNAIKFTSKGEIRFGYKIKGDWIEAYVADTGMGIAPEKVDKVFDRFVKLNTFAQGTGLGLSICKMILNIVGGDIWVESEVGKGSTFYFKIPHKAEHSKTKHSENVKNEESAEKVNMTEKPTKDVPTILVAEDVLSNFLLLKALIGKNFNLVWAKDGAEAVKMFKEKRPKMILMDVKMPNMDGLEATRMIRSFSSTVPIIALSAFAFEADKQKAFDAGVNSYLTKPLTRQALEDTIKKYFE